MPHPSHFSRRKFLQLSMTVGGLAATGTGSVFADARPIGSPAPPNADEVLQRLLEGNQRFIAGKLSHPRRKPEDFRPLAEGQSPIATIVGCADSRVSPELLFDQGVGDLFVVRVAGNVISGAGAVVQGSIEYAVTELGVPFLMVLGHSNCGAVKTALKHSDASAPLPAAIDELVSTIKPAIAKVKNKPGDPLDNAIKANVEMGVEYLKTLEPIVAGSVKQGTLKIVGATYDLQSGRVTVIN